MLDAYLKIKSGLIKSLTRLENTASSERVKAAAQLLSVKLQADIFSLVVVGQFKRGKSTFINALLGEDILPAAVIPLTSIITILGYGDKLQITVFFQNGTEKKIMREELSLYITEKHNPKNEKGVNRVEIAYPSLYLKNGVQIIDTPGIASVHEHNTQTTYEYLPSADAAMFVIGVDPPLTQAELQFLRDIKNTVGKTFFIQSKIDTVSEADREESLAFSKKLIEKDAHFGDVVIYPLSGKEALEGKKDGDSQKVKRSGLFNFEQSLEQFLVNEKGKVLVQSVAEKAESLVNEELLFAELEEKSLMLPFNELENRIATFKNFIQESGREKIDGERLLAEEVKELKEKILEEDLEKLMVKETKRLLEKVEEFAHANANASNAKFAELMGNFFDVQIRKIFSEWRIREEKILNKHLEEIFKRFLNRINKIIEQIMHSSAELFEISYRQIQIPLVMPPQIEFRFLTMDEPGILNIIIDLGIRALPKKLGHKLIIKDARGKARMLVGRHCAKAGYDFSMRMEKFVRNYRIDMAKTIGSIQNDVLKALEAGIASKQNAAFEAESYEKRINDKIKTLKEISKSLKIPEL